MTPASLPAQDRFLALDGARGLAALAVVCYHMATLLGVSYEGYGGYHYFSRAYLAVDLFFLMSGFVIAHAYEARLQSGQLDLGRFLLLRLARLYPLYLLGLAGGIAVWLFAHAGPDMPSFWSSLALGSVLLPQLAGGGSDAPIYPFNVAAWSLGFELVANLAFAGFLARLPTRILVVLCVLAAAMLAAYGVIDGSLDIGFKASQAGEGLARASASFIAGQIVFRQWAAGKLPAFGWPAPAQLAVLALLLAVPAGMAGLAYELVMVAAVFPLFLIAGCQARPPRHCRWFFTQAGRLSYALYILHVPVCHAIAAAWLAVLGQPIAATPVAGGATILAAVMAVAFAATAAFDEPVRRFLMARLQRRPKNQASAMPSLPALATR